MAFGSPRAQVRVKRCGKSAPASGATRAARQPPPGARSKRGAAGPATCPQVDRSDGWPPIRTPARDRWTEPRLQAGSPSFTPLTREFASMRGPRGPPTPHPPHRRTNQAADGSRLRATRTDTKASASSAMPVARSFGAIRVNQGELRGRGDGQLARGSPHSDERHQRSRRGRAPGDLRGAVRHGRCAGVRSGHGQAARRAGRPAACVHRGSVQARGPLVSACAR